MNKKKENFFKFKEILLLLAICIIFPIIISISLKKIRNNHYYEEKNKESNKIKEKIKENTEEYDNNSQNFPTKNMLDNTVDYKVINIFPRKNPTVYTQGLYYNNKTIYESGGLYRKSTLTHMEWPSQKIIKKVNLEEKYFAEGIVANNKYLYQLTYKEREILVYSIENLELIKKIKMPQELREGWGMSIGTKKDEFLATDGSDKIFTLKLKENNELYVSSYINVTYYSIKMYNLNELTYDGNYIFSNVYFTNEILKINPDNGNILKIYNMQPLIDYELKNGKLTKNRINYGDVLNGIVYVPITKSFILTGKLWDFYYEVIFEK